jgi:TRAP-type C4-dicarboxylate transport system substrate-binding protein
MKMKGFVATAVLVLLLVVFSVGQAADTKVFNLKYWTPNQKDWWQGAADQRFIDSVKAATGGRVIITPYWGSSLAPDPEALSLLKSGVIDIAHLGAPLYPGEFPVSDVVSLPFISRTSADAATLLKALRSKGLMPELDKIKFGFFRMTDMIYLMLKNKEVNKLEDMKGLKIRVSAGIANDTLPALGAVPVAIKPPDLYMSIDRGIVDGLMSSPGFMGPNKIFEVAKVFVDEPLWVGINFIVMNPKAWDAFPNDIKAIMEKEFEKAEKDWQAENFKYEAVNKDLIKKGGAKIINLSDAEMTRWKKATDPVVEKFVKKLNDLGLKGNQVMEEARKISAKK